MGRATEHLSDPAKLYPFAEVEHPDPIGDLTHDAEVVSDQQHGHALFAAEFLDQRQNLRLGLARHRPLTGRGRGYCGHDNAADQQPQPDADHGHDRHGRIAERMPPQHDRVGNAFCPGGADVSSPSTSIILARVMRAMSAT